MRMKICVMAAALAAFFMLPFICMTALATELDEPDDVIVTEEQPAQEDVVFTEELPVQEEIIVGEMPIINENPVTDYHETPPRPFTPSGTGTVVDYATDSDGKLFYTIMTPDEHIFYLVIDRQRNSENVYFLNAVTIADLAALAELPPQPQYGTAMPAPTPQVTEIEPPVDTPPIVEEPDGGNTGMYIFIGAVVIIGGAAGWYFKVYRPKQQGTSGGEEYEQPVADDDNEYPGEWGDEQGGADDDSPPWDDDESGDESGDDE